MTTEAQIESNKQNSKLSTGPKDKSKTRLNAKKFGIFSKEMVIVSKFFSEDKKDFDRISEGFYEEYDPQTETERLFVERIIQCAWRLRRISMAEKAIIQRRTKELPEKTLEDLEFNDNMKLLHSHHKKDMSELAYMSDITLEELGKHAQDHVKQIEQGDTEFTKETLRTEGFSEEEINKMDSETLKNTCLERVENIPLFYEAVREYKQIMRDFLLELSKKEALVLPENYMQNLMTYETAIERQLFRAIEMLRRLKNRD